MRRTPPKSRAPADRPRVVVHPPRHNNGQQRYAESPGYSGHNGGSFDEAGYSTGQGVFGFRHHTMTTGRRTR